MNFADKEIIIFDLDGTLAPSKSPLEPDMAEFLGRLLKKKKVAVVSGGSYKQFGTQFLEGMPNAHQVFANLILMPTSGTQMYTWKEEGWVEEYNERLSAEEKEKIINAIESTRDEVGFNDPDEVYGPPVIEDRESQITFSALGQKTPLDIKTEFDPGHDKREVVAKILREKLPEFNIGVNAYTSIDITRKGVDKSYAIKKLSEYLNLPITKMLFVGDALFEGGNDYPAKTTGVDCAPVHDPEETKKLIASWL